MLTPPADNQTLQTFANMTMPEECPANVTQCVVLLFLNEESGMDKQVSGGCYDPTALWVRPTNTLFPGMLRCCKVVTSC